MPSTHVSLHSHVIFSTKERMPFISPEWRDRLHSYLGGNVKGPGGTPLAIGGTADHVHLLIGFKSSHRLDHFLRDLKADSSEWIHRQIGKQTFAWQKGYGAFSVSPSNLDAVRKYIAVQENHHRRYSLQEEYLKLLKSSGIDFGYWFSLQSGTGVPPVKTTRKMRVPPQTEPVPDFDERYLW